MRIAFVRAQSDRQAAMLRVLRDRGHDVLCFEDSGEALEAIRTDSAIDMLATGAFATPISGLEVCREARLLAGETRALYILFVLPPGDSKTKIEALDSGADETLDELSGAEEFQAKLRVAERITSLQRELVKEASTDYLSGADNRRSFFRKLSSACGSANGGEPLSVIYVDLDRFKAINDRYGHDVGDEALRAIVKAAHELNLFVGRLGGDEFGVILEASNLSSALETTSALKAKICAARLHTSEGTASVTCSMGVSEYQPGDSPDDLMKRADLALYQAKGRGGDAVATTPKDSWMNGRPRHGVSLVRLLPRPSSEVRDRRKRQPASPALVARVCAVVDLLIASGLDEDVAFETLGQRLVVADIPLPKKRNASSSWPAYLREQRVWLRSEEPAEEVLKEYRSVVDALDAMAPHERVGWALENDVWDRRRERASVPTSVWIPIALPAAIETASTNNTIKKIAS